MSEIFLLNSLNSWLEFSVYMIVEAQEFNKKAAGWGGLRWVSLWSVPGLPDKVRRSGSTPPGSTSHHHSTNC